MLPVADAHEVPPGGEARACNAPRIDGEASTADEHVQCARTSSLQVPWTLARSQFYIRAACCALFKHGLMADRAVVVAYLGCLHAQRTRHGSAAGREPCAHVTVGPHQAAGRAARRRAPGTASRPARRSGPAAAPAPRASRPASGRFCAAGGPGVRVLGFGKGS